MEKWVPMNKPQVVEESFTILNELGLHARPVMLLVQAISRLNCSVSIEKDNIQADAHSVMSVLTLGAEPGSTIKVIAQGVDAAEAIEAIRKLIHDKFGED